MGLKSLFTMHLSFRSRKRPGSEAPLAVYDISEAYLDEAKLGRQLSSCSLQMQLLRRICNRKSLNSLALRTVCSIPLLGSFHHIISIVYHMHLLDATRCYWQGHTAKSPSLLNNSESRYVLHSSRAGEPCLYDFNPKPLALEVTPRC